MRLLAAQLQELKPGVVACQECFYSDEGKADTLKFLAGELNMEYSFVPGRLKKRYFDGEWVESISGLGILSAYPIIKVDSFDLPVVTGDEDRKAQLVQLLLPNGAKLLVANTHLTHLKDTKGRKAQADALAGMAMADKTCTYVIICGDFNAEPDSVEIKSLIKKSGAVDCYAAGKGIEPRYSLTNAHERKIAICVDHLFSLPVAGGKVYPEFINSAIVLNIADELTGIYPSDHFGISTTLVIN